MAKLFGFRDTKNVQAQNSSWPPKSKASAKVVKIAKPKTLTWLRSEQRFPPGFYTYRLLDPKDGLAFYVGKGQRNRAWNHDAAVRRGDLSGNLRKVAKIQEIIQRGDEVEIDVVACYELESDALDHEFRLVDANPTLTNIAPGGGGAPLSEANQARKIALRAEKMKRLRAAERSEAEKTEVETRRAAFLAKANSDAERAQIQNWLDNLDQRAADKLLRPLSTTIRARDNRQESQGPTSRPRGILGPKRQNWG